MKAFLKTKVGIISVIGFMALMAFVLHRTTRRHKELHPAAAAATPESGPVARSILPPASPPSTPPTISWEANRPASPLQTASDLAENAANLDQVYELDRRVAQDRDRQGNAIIRRQNARTPTDVGTTSEETSTSPASGMLGARPSHRLQGRPSLSLGAAVAAALPIPKPGLAASAVKGLLAESPRGILAAASKPRSRPQRFNPYGAVIKCELVFTLDSTTEETPLIAVVMEPVYNNGALVIPAGAEFHGTARPDRLRDRIFSGQDWVLVFPREQDRINGRQLNVRGVALDRVEPDANGMTWGITDGSYGLEGKVIRSLADEEIKRFVATFLAAGAETMQERQTDRGGQQSVRNTPQNAVLQGLGANFQKIADEISAEIAQHGVFIRIPAGHQFYFYPMQIIDPDAADVSSDIATVQ